MLKKRYHDFPLKIFCLTVPKKIRRGTLVFQKLSGFKKTNEQKNGRGYYDSRSKNFLSRSIETFRKGTLLRSRKILVSKNFMDKRFGTKYHDFSSKKNLSHSTEKLVGELFGTSEKFRYRKTNGITYKL